MGFMDKFTGGGKHKDKVADVVDDHADKIEQGMDRTGDFADDKTGGKYSDQIDQGSERAKDGLDSLDGKDDDFGAAGTDTDTDTDTDRTATDAGRDATSS